MKYQRTCTNNSENGFSIVEVIVTLVVVSIFLFGFLQSYLLLESQRIGVARQAKASDITISNLNKVTVRTSINCDPSGFNLADPITPPSYNLLTNIENELGSGAGQSLIAYPSVDCTGTNFIDNPIRIESKAWFYVNGVRTEVSHASFVQ
jgi:prepilin-type N-terminal cleavage/methylation domain-containing protein